MYTDVAKVGQSSDICKICAAGEYSDETASTACTKCSAGRYLAIIRSDNSVTDHNSHEKCLVCPEDEYQELTGKKGCNRCRKGYIIEDSKDPLQHNSITDCYLRGGVAPCPKGSGRTIIDGNEGGQCNVCEIGRYGDGKGASCTLCRSGFYSDQTGQHKCKPCNDASNTAPCSFLPGTTSNTPSTGLFASFNMVDSTRAGIAAPFETEKSMQAENVVEEDPNQPSGPAFIIYIVLFCASLAVLSIHRLFCSQCLEADVMFARSGKREDVMFF